MCTAINFLDQANETVFGRTMDFYAILDPHLVSFPAGASWETMLGQTLADQYGVGGIGRHAQHRYVLFDGVNEMGLAGGALYFKGYADFPQPSKHSVRSSSRRWTSCTTPWAAVLPWTTSGNAWPISPWWESRMA